MMNFVIVEVLAFLVFLGIAAAALPDGDAPKKKVVHSGTQDPSNIRQGHLFPLRGTQGLYLHQAQQDLGDTLYLLQRRVLPEQTPLPHLQQLLLVEDIQ